MIIVYCDKCGLRVPQDEIQNETALRRPSGKYLCAPCAPTVSENLRRQSSRSLIRLSSRTPPDGTAMLAALKERSESSKRTIVIRPPSSQRLPVVDIPRRASSTPAAPRMFARNEKRKPIGLLAVAATTAVAVIVVFAAIQSTPARITPPSVDATAPTVAPPAVPASKAATPPAVARPAQPSVKLAAAGTAPVRNPRADSAPRTTTDGRPWVPVFNGQTLDCLDDNGSGGWKFANGAIVNIPGLKRTAQTRRNFGDGDIRVRFEVQRSTCVQFAIRQGEEGGYTANFDRVQLQEIGSNTQELIFSCDGDHVSATLNGKPFELEANGKPSSGNLQFYAKDGTLRVLVIDYAEPSS